MGGAVSGTHVPGLVSVCVPSYNHAEFLAAAIESVLRQSYAEFELVVADDGSTDGSLRIAEEYAARDPERLRVVAHPGRVNRGIAATVNLAFQHARGEFWCGLGSDDEFYPDKLERQVRYLRANPTVGFVYGPVQYMNREGKDQPYRYGRDLNRLGDPLVALVLKNPIPGMAVMARREAMEEAGLRNEELVYNDWEYWLRLLALSRVGYLESPLARRRLHSTNVSLGASARKNASRYLAVVSSLRRLGGEEGVGRLAENRIQALLTLRQAEFHFQLAALEDAAGALDEAFRIDPQMAGEPRLLVRWLAPRQHQTGGPGDPPFGPWVVDRLTGHLARGDHRRLRAYLRAFELRRRAVASSEPTAARLTAAFGAARLDPGHLVLRFRGFGGGGRAR